ncbi:unnamed protein product [Urochloa humidicola]
MGLQETPVVEVLRAAAAEVSTASVNRRLLLFRHTLPHLLAKALELPSDTALLVDLIFQTLPIYDDRASRTAVDDMVIQVLGKPTFMKPFAAVLVQSMEKNLKITNPLTSFKLLRWSHYLLKWSQFATLSKGAFSRLANAQAVLCQVLMNGSFRWRQTCKHLFIHLFSEPSGIYKMYIDEVKDLRISMRDSPAFLNLILDFTITSPSLSAEYKSMFLDLYVKTILSSKDRPPKAATEAFKPLFLEIGHEDFKNTVMPSCIKMLKRNPEIILQSIGYLLKTVRLDLSKYCMEFMPVVLHQARHSDEERRINAVNIIVALSEKSSDPDALHSMVNAIKAILGGSEGKLSVPYQRIGMLNALEQLSRSPPKQTGKLAPSVSSFLLTCYKDDGIEEVKLAILSALGSWALVSAEAVQPDVVSFIAAGLKEKDTLRKGHLKLLRVICKNPDSLTKVTSLLDHLIQLPKTGFSKETQRLDGIYALFAVLRLAAVDTKEDRVDWEELRPLIAENQMLPKLPEDCLAFIDLLELLLTEHLFRVRTYFSIQSLLQLLIYLVCHPSWEVRKAAYDATKKILSNSTGLVEDTLFLFTDWLSLVGERVRLRDRLSVLEQSDKDSSSDSELPFFPSIEILVKCLLLIAPYAVVHSLRLYSRLILCSHHPCLSGSASPDGRLQRKLKQQIVLTDISVICEELVSQDGLFSSDKKMQSAALCSLSTLMAIDPIKTPLTPVFLTYEFNALEVVLRLRNLLNLLHKEGQVKAGAYVIASLALMKVIEFHRDIIQGAPQLNKKSKKATWDDYDSWTFCKMCIEEGGIGDQNDLFIEKLFCRTGRVYTWDQLVNKHTQFKRMYTDWKKLEINVDGRERNPTKKLKDLVAKFKLLELPGFTDLLGQMHKVESGDLNDEVVEPPPVVTQCHCLDETSIINTLEDKVKRLELSLEESLKENEEVERCRRISEEKRIEAEEEVQRLKKLLLESDVERKKLHKQMMELKGNIRVFCRVRPGKLDGLEFHYPESLELAGRGIQLKNNDHDVSYTFDKVFNDKASQAEIFEEISELVQSSLDGYKVTIFSYGQTGSGKTHTMIGKANQEGMIPRALDKVFETKEKYMDWQFDIEVSMFEIYKEKINDLLDPADKKTCIMHSDENGNCSIKGLTKVSVHSKQDATEAFQKGLKRRAVGKTHMNEVSSRSHFIFMLIISRYKEDLKHKIQGLLQLIDLAGSETASTTDKVDNATQTESKNINQSLLYLSNVFDAIANGSEYLGYRNCKLTQFLQNSFTGDSKVLMFVNIAPEMQSLYTTLKTLEFADRVNKCKLRKQDKRLLHGTNKENDALKQKMSKSAIKQKTVDPKTRGVKFGTSAKEPISRLRAQAGHTAHRL